MITQFLTIKTDLFWDVNIEKIRGLPADAAENLLGKEKDYL
jgi:hypothetical protein